MKTKTRKEKKLQIPFLGFTHVKLPSVECHIHLAATND